MEILEKAVDMTVKKFEKTPGFGYVVVLASATGGIVLKLFAPESSWLLPLVALAVSFVAYWVGGFLDDIIFEPLYGLQPKEGRPSTFSKWLAGPGARLDNMIEERARAAKKFHLTNQKGIYKTAKKLLSNTELWDGRIKLCLDFSKVFRTLIIPMACLLGWQLLAASTDLPVAGLGCLILTTSITVISIMLYVNLRLHHMRLLYKTVADMPAFRFVVNVTAGCWPPPEVLWSVGDRVISERALLVCQTDPNKK